MVKEVKTRIALEPYGWTGLGIMAGAEALLFSGISWVATYFTPLVWTGYILFIDSLVQRNKGTSLLRNRPGEFLFMLFISTLFWYLFEFYNVYLENWHYVGLPEELYPWRILGYIWAFATIWPAILETGEALATWPGISRRKIPRLRVRLVHLAVSFVFGALCLVIPFVVSPSVAHYMAGPVWVGFIFLLDPLNYWMGRHSILRELEIGDPRTFYSLILSGIICGFLWEFWNYWAGAKWHYTVPILGKYKIFEMPVLGYLGFPPFAVECYTMYYFVLNLIRFRSAPNGSHL